MTDIFEIIDNLQQLKSMKQNGELTVADIDHFIRKYQSRVEQFEMDQEEDESRLFMGAVGTPYKEA
jgi:hypothetical protein